MPNVPAKNTAGKKSASYGNSGGAKKMVSKKVRQADNGGGIGESKHGDHEEMVRIEVALSTCSKDLGAPVRKMKQSCRAMMCNYQHRYQMEILSELR